MKFGEKEVTHLAFNLTSTIMVYFVMIVKLSTKAGRETLQIYSELVWDNEHIEMFGVHSNVSCIQKVDHTSCFLCL